MISSCIGLLIVSSWTRSVISFFRGLGILGPFLLETLDSSFFYLPLANELLLLALITRDESGWLWIVYALMAALGSVAGTFLVDLLMRKAGEKGLEKFVKAERAKWLKERLKNGSRWFVFVSSAMPPPFPFRMVILAASALQSPRKELLISVFAGRFLRFSVEALLIVFFGRRLLSYLNSDILEYVMYALLAAGVVGSALTFYKWFRSRESESTT